MHRTSRFLVLAFLLLSGWVHAQVISSNFNADSEFWVAYANADPNTTVVFSAGGGTGGTGAIILQEPANGANDYFVAPAKFYDLYPLNSIPLPQNPTDDLDDIPAAHKAIRPQLWNNM